MALTTWYILPEIDQLCSKCPVPRRCNENDPRCLRHQAIAAGNVSRRKPAKREMQVLDYLEKHPGQHRGVDIVNAIGAPYKTITNLLQRLKAKGQVTHTGERHTSRWTANTSPKATAGSNANTGTNVTS